MMENTSDIQDFGAQVIKGEPPKSSCSLTQGLIKLPGCEVEDVQPKLIRQEPEPLRPHLAKRKYREEASLGLNESMVEDLKEEDTEDSKFRPQLAILYNAKRHLSTATTATRTTTTITKVTTIIPMITTKNSNFRILR